MSDPKGQVGHATWINTDSLEWAYGGQYGTQGEIDLGLLFANQFTPIPTSEPSTLVLLLSGMLALWVGTRKASLRSSRRGLMANSCKEHGFET
jgi:hypothetical protein